MTLPSWRTDKRSAAQRGYDAHWRRRREQQLTLHPLCCMCQRKGIIRAANTADHITPHKGDPVLFQGPLQSLCSTCHSGDKARIEHGRAPLVKIGVDGYPVPVPVEP